MKTAFAVFHSLRGLPSESVVIVFPQRISIPSIKPHNPPTPQVINVTTI